RHVALDAGADAEQIPGAPAVEGDPEMSDAAQRPPAEQARGQGGQDAQAGARIEDQNEGQRPKEGHQMPIRSAARPSRYLLYSTKVWRKSGSVVTASATIMTSSARRLRIS